MSRFLSLLTNLILPPNCVICNQRLTGDENNVLCSTCNPEFTTSDKLRLESDSTLSDDQSSGLRSLLTCDICGERSTKWGHFPERCIACYLWPLPVRRVRSLWRYSNQAKAIIKALKYGMRRPLARYISDILVKAVADEKCFAPDDNWDIIVPLPSSSASLRSRGFSHIALISRGVSRHLNVPLHLWALRSIRPRKPQASLSLEERHGNVYQAFTADRSKVNDKRVLLIDDVITTGASIWSAADSLLQAGARSVDALTLARSREFQTYRLLPSPFIKEQPATKLAGNL